MTGLLYALAPTIAGAVIARTERAHRPVALALGASALYSLASLAPLPSELRLILWALVALASARAYVRVFGLGWPKTLHVVALAASVTAIATPFGASPWQIATWAPWILSTAIGLVSLAFWALLREGLPPKPLGIAQRCAVALLASDVAMLLFVPWPGAQAWQGRAAAVAVTAMQLVWMKRKG